MIADTVPVAARVPQTGDVPELKYVKFRSAMNIVRIGNVRFNAAQVERYTPMPRQYGEERDLPLDGTLIVMTGGSTWATALAADKVDEVLRSAGYEVPEGCPPEVATPQTAGC